MPAALVFRALVTRVIDNDCGPNVSIPAFSCEERRTVVFLRLSRRCSLSSRIDERLNHLKSSQRKDMSEYRIVIKLTRNQTFIRIFYSVLFFELIFCLQENG